MVKLFLAEDERIMREGIKKHIDWESEGIEFVGEAGDGEMAYPMILNLKPDILITDIRMPFMDGLELTELVKKELPGIRVIILSGFDEFTYAQKAVSLGVSEYLLKPISPSKLLESIRRLAAAIEAENPKGQTDWTQEEMAEKAELERSRLFTDVIMNRQPVPELIETGKRLGIDLTLPWFRILLVQFAVRGEAGDAFSETRNAFQDKLMSLVSIFPGLSIGDRGAEGFLLWQAGTDEHKMKQDTASIVSAVTQIAKEFSEAHYFIGVGDLVGRLREVGHGYETAGKAFSYRFLMTPDRTVYCSGESVSFSENASGKSISGADASVTDASVTDASVTDASVTDASGADASGTDASGMIASGTDSSGADASGKSASAANVFGSLSFPDAVYGSPSGNKTGGIDTGDAVARESSHKALESFLRTGTFDEAALFIGSMFESIGEMNVKSTIFLQYLTVDSYLLMIRFLQEIGEPQEKADAECGDLNTVLSHLNNWQESRQYLTDYLRAVIRLRDTTSAAKYGKILGNSIKYIDSHFADPDISLNTAASQANLSPNHFSAIFSQQIGTTFIEYLIGRRMEKAKELLMTTDIRSSEIAYQVGYKDPHYFSHTFKKTQGVSPKEYRQRGKNADEG